MTVTVLVDRAGITKFRLDATFNDFGAIYTLPNGISILSKNIRYGARIDTYRIDIDDDKDAVWFMLSYGGEIVK